MKNIGYPDTKNKQSSSPLYSTDPKEKKKAEPLPDGPGPKKPHEDKDLPSNPTGQKQKPLQARVDAILELLKPPVKT